MRASIAAALSLCLLAGACATRWEPQYGPAPQVAAAHVGGTVRVVRNDQSSVVLEQVSMSGDSIVGMSGDPPQRVAIALSDVRVMSVPRRDDSTARTAIITVGVVVVSLIAAGVIAIFAFDDLFEF